MSVLSGILKAFVGDKSKKDLKGLYPLVDKIHLAAATFDGITNDQLRDQTNTFKKEILKIRKPLFDKIDALKTSIEQTIDLDEKETHYNEIDSLEKKAHEEVARYLDNILPQAFAVVKETAKDVANAPPKYFFDLANKIKLLGKESKVKPSERVNEYSYTGKNGDEYVMTEDISTGDIQITKDKTGVGSSGEKTFDVIEDKSVMNYKAPRKDADPDTQTILDEGAEYDEFQVTFDADGSMADGDVIQDSIKKEIIEEASDGPIKQKIKRAGGGVAYMLGE